VAKDMNEIKPPASRHVWWHVIVVFFHRVLKDTPQIGVSIAVFLVGLLFFTQMEGSLRLIVGVPAMVAGVASAFLHLYEIWESLLDKEYSQSHCVLCQKEK